MRAGHLLGRLKEVRAEKRRRREQTELDEKHRVEREAFQKQQQYVEEANRNYALKQAGFDIPPGAPLLAPGEHVAPGVMGGFPTEVRCRYQCDK